MGPLFKCNTPINFKGDTIVHYAFYKKDAVLIKYLKNRSDFLCTVRNLVSESPLDLAKNDKEILALIS